MPSIEKQKQLGMRTEDGRWINGDRVRTRKGHVGTVIHCDGMRMELRVGEKDNGPIQTIWVRSNQVEEAT